MASGAASSQAVVADERLVGERRGGRTPGRCPRRGRASPCPPRWRACRGTARRTGGAGRPGCPARVKPAPMAATTALGRPAPSTAELQASALAASVGRAAQRPGGPLAAGRRVLAGPLGLDLLGPSAAPAAASAVSRVQRISKSTASPSRVSVASSSPRSVRGVVPGRGEGGRRARRAAAGRRCPVRRRGRSATAGRGSPRGSPPAPREPRRSTPSSAAAG